MFKLLSYIEKDMSLLVWSITADIGDITYNGDIGDKGHMGEIES